MENCIPTIHFQVLLLLVSGSVYLGGGFKYFLFSTLFREDSHFDDHIFQMGWFNHQLVYCWPTSVPTFALPSPGSEDRPKIREVQWHDTRRNTPTKLHFYMVCL